MQITEDPAAWNARIADQEAQYRKALNMLGTPPHQHTADPEPGRTRYNESWASTFRSYAETWLKMLDSTKAPVLRKPLLYTILWCAKDVAHPFIDRTWKELGVDPEELRTELQEIMDEELKDMLEYYRICKRVGISLPGY